MVENPSSYSANVDMFLILEDHKLPLGQLGRTHCILEQAVDFPPQSGEIVLVIDGSESRLPVFFPQGASPASCRVSYLLQTASTADSPVVATR